MARDITTHPEAKRRLSYTASELLGIELSALPASIGEEQVHQLACFSIRQLRLYWPHGLPIVDGLTHRFIDRFRVGMGAIGKIANRSLQIHGSRAVPGRVVRDVEPVPLTAASIALDTE